MMDKKALEEDPLVKAWLNKIHKKTGSKRTRKNYVRDFKWFMDWAQSKGYYDSPEDLVKKAQDDLRNLRKDYRERLDEYLIYLEEVKGLSRNTASVTIAAPRSFLRYNDVVFPKGDYPETWKEKDEALPDIGALKKFLEQCDLRTKAILLSMRDSGLAAQDVLDLKYGDIAKQLDNDFIHIHRKRMKVKEWHDTFLGPESVSAIKLYLDQRRRGSVRRIYRFKGKDNGGYEEVGIPPESLTDESPLFRTFERGVKPLSVDRFQNEMNESSRRFGVKIKSHQLRKYFITALYMAGVPEAIVEYWAGHSIGKVKRTYVIPSVEAQLGLYTSKYNALRFEKSVDEKISQIEERYKGQIRELEEKVSRLEEARTTREPADELMSKLIGDPEVQRILKRKLKQLGLT